MARASRRGSLLSFAFRAVSSSPSARDLIWSRSDFIETGSTIRRDSRASSRIAAISPVWLAAAESATARASAALAHQLLCASASHSLMYGRGGLVVKYSDGTV